MSAVNDKFCSLSRRAVENVANNGAWRTLRQALATPYHKDRYPEGKINLAMAESSLMHEELIDHLHSHFDVDPLSHLTYGSGPNGSPRLLEAVSSFFNSHFQPVMPVGEELIITSGVTSSIDSLTWCICAPGEGILVSQPLYPGFPTYIEMRSRGHLLPVSFLRDNHNYCIDEVFDAKANRKAFERALKQYEAEGITIRAVLLSNPHNPLGRCHSTDTLKEIARFCSQYSLHLISDEIYANSTFSNPCFPDATAFSSILSINMEGIIDPQFVHVIYGMSKDFCANGLRLGVLQTRNENLHEAVSSINVFSWPSYVTQDLWARILEDREFLDRFITENQNRLAKSYTVCTTFLDKHDIPYLKGGNAGFFVWAQLLKPDSASTIPRSTLQTELVKTCARNGVFIRDGSAYFAEEREAGWFRITFTLDQVTLEEAMERLMKSVRET